MNVINRVLLEKKVKQEMDLMPSFIQNKFRGWVQFVELYGIREARLIKSFHDEPLKGKRLGQRSIRLNRSYRAIYVELSDNKIEIIKVIEVHKHDY
jgi:proteic killer suppression protein